MKAVELPGQNELRRLFDFNHETGHRDIKQLLTYFNETAENLAAKLD
jgi:hypothetical protein